MYFLFVNHDWEPSRYFDAHSTDQSLIRAFIRKEVEDAEERRHG